MAVGDQTIKQLRYTEGAFKQSGFQKIEPANYTAHCWAAEDRLIVGTDQGRLLVFDNGELKVSITPPRRVTKCTPLVPHHSFVKPIVISNLKRHFFLQLLFSKLLFTVLEPQKILNVLSNIYKSVLDLLEKLNMHEK